jgi:hypothetical protein
VLLSDLLEVLGPIAVETDFLLAELVEPFGVAFNGGIKAGLILIVVLIARFYNLFMMISVLNVHITRELILLTYNGACGDWSSSCWAGLIY